MRTEEAYVHWAREFIFFHENKSGEFRHPADMDMQEVNDFTTYLAVERKVSAATQNQALSALTFLYKNVLGKALRKEQITNVRAAVPKRLARLLFRMELVKIPTDKYSAVSPSERSGVGLILYQVFLEIFKLIQ